MKNGNAIGVIELSSLFKGFEVQDAVLKTTKIEKLLARTICSGKYIILVRGEIADVEACIRQSSETGGFARAGLCATHNVAAFENGGNGLALYRSGIAITFFGYSTE